MMDLLAYLDCLESLEVRETLEIRDPLGNQVGMGKMVPEDLKETLVNQVLKVYQEDKVELVRLEHLDLQVLWWKVKRFQDPLDLQVLMEHQGPLDPQVSREKWEHEEIQDAMEKTVNLDHKVIQV